MDIQPLPLLQYEAKGTHGSLLFLSTRCFSLLGPRGVGKIGAGVGKQNWTWVQFVIKLFSPLIRKACLPAGWTQIFGPWDEGRTIDCEGSAVHVSPLLRPSSE
jgi:hypothetical protein